MTESMLAYVGSVCWLMEIYTG